MTQTEQQIRITKLQHKMSEHGVTSLLLRSIPAFLYLTDTVMQGFIYVPSSGAPFFFLERVSRLAPSEEKDRTIMIRKPEDIPALLAERGHEIDAGTALELGQMPVTDYLRLRKLSSTGEVSKVDGSLVLRETRMIKTDAEITEMRRLGQIHMEIYRLAPDLFRPGMTDLQWQHEIEYQMRRRGSIGLFRTYGWRMEIFQGNLITGESSGAPAPYDFAMGGKGNNAYPSGASGTVIRPGQTVMVDMAGNYGTLMTDMTRTFSVGEVAPLAQKAHDCSIAMHEWFGTHVKPGFPIADTYTYCLEMAEKAGLSAYFMGTKEWKSKFVGHGLGIEINELPVLTGRWKGVFEENMAIAFEPKFVLPEIGPAGVENTYVVTADGVDNITPLTPELLPLRTE